MSTSPILLDQMDYFSLIASDEYFGDIRVLRQNKGVTEDDINVALSTLLEQGGKIGACAVVLMPDLKPDDSEGETARYFERIAIQVIAQPLFADDETSGVKKAAEELATRIMQICHGRTFGRKQTFMFDGMEPIPADPGKVSYGIYFRRTGGDISIAKPARPVITAVSGTVTITCATGGAAIRYTTDGSAPYAANPDSLPYTVPFTVSETTTIRAAATKAGMQPSEVAAAEVEASANPSGENPEEITITTADVLDFQSNLPGKEILRIAVPVGTYSVAGFMQFALVNYVQIAPLVGFRFDVGDPLGVQLQQTLWDAENIAYPDPETSSGHGPGAYGADPQYAQVESTSGFLALYLRSPEMTSGSLVLAPGDVTISATRIF